MILYAFSKNHTTVTQRHSALQRKSYGSAVGNASLMVKIAVSHVTVICHRMGAWTLDLLLALRSGGSSTIAMDHLCLLRAAQVGVAM